MVWCDRKEKTERYGKKESKKARNKERKEGVEGGQLDGRSDRHRAFPTIIPVSRGFVASAQLH